METIENINIEITQTQQTPTTPQTPQPQTPQPQTPQPQPQPQTPQPQPQTPQPQPQPHIPDLLNIEVKDQITALNVLINYITIAQKRGIFSIQESAHIWSCIQLFISQGSSPSTIDVNEKKKI